MKKVNLIILALSLLILFLSCAKDGYEFNSQNHFAYTQEEKENEQLIIQNYLKKNNLEMWVTDSGLHYLVEIEGNGLRPDCTDRVFAHYEVFNLTTDTIARKVDASTSLLGEPFSMLSTTEGLKEAFLRIRQGAVFRVIVPSYLGYGKADIIGQFPPQSILDYKFKINKVINDTIPQQKKLKICFQH